MLLYFFYINWVINWIAAFIFITYEMSFSVCHPGGRNTVQGCILIKCQSNVWNWISGKQRHTLRTSTTKNFSNNIWKYKITAFAQKMSQAFKIWKATLWKFSIQTCKLQTWIQWVCSQEIPNTTISLKPPRSDLSATLVQDKRFEPNSPNGLEL